MRIRKVVLPLFVVLAILGFVLGFLSTEPAQAGYPPNPCNTWVVCEWNAACSGVATVSYSYARYTPEEGCLDLQIVVVHCGC